MNDPATGFIVIALVHLGIATAVLVTAVIKKRNWAPAFWTALGAAAVYELIGFSLVFNT